MPKVKAAQLAKREDIEEGSDENDSSKSPKVDDASTNKILTSQKEVGTHARLYVNFKKKIESLGFEPKTLHPKVLSVRLPRRGVHSKFCFLLFKTEKSALLAEKKIRERGDCFVKLAKTHAGPKTKLAKIKKVKGKKSKEGLRKLWA